jgi:DNA polymerase III subunit epsilon
MKVLGLDFETTGLDPKVDQVTEVGMVLFDTDMHQPVRISGFLVRTEFGITSEITELTGITDAMLDAYGFPPSAALQSILKMAAGADAFCAHNGKDFDRLFLETWCAREKQQMPSLLWLDTRTDLPKEAYKKSASMFYMAAEHGFLYDAHRAVSDVLAMLKILDRYDIKTVVERAKTPNVQVRAVVSYDEKDLAKERGYHWKPELKLWVKQLKLSEVETEKEAAPFSVVLMEATNA